MTHMTHGVSHASSSLDIILRHDTVERAKAGDKSLFVGTLVAIPDVSMLSTAGVLPQSHLAQN